MNKAEFKPGTRLSWIDCVFMGFVLAGCYHLQTYPWYVNFILLYVTVHFFLFCNVFRVSRKPEIIWAVVFTLLCSSTLILHTPGWIITIAITGTLSVYLIVREMQQAFYHGIFWQKINPGLREWWEANNKNNSLL